MSPLPAPSRDDSQTSSGPQPQKAVFHRNLPKKVKKNKVALLAAKSLETNAGEKVKWRVVKRAKFCKIKGKKMPDLAAWNVEKQQAKKSGSSKSVTKKKDLDKVPSWVVKPKKKNLKGRKKASCVVEAYTENTPSGYEDYSKKRKIRIIL